MMNELTQEKAFELAKEAIIREHDPTADDFYLVSAEMEEDEWVLMVGCLTYFTDETVGSDVAEYYGYTDEDIDTPSGHWQIQVIVLPDGGAYTTAYNNLDLSEHPDEIAPLSNQSNA